MLDGALIFDTRISSANRLRQIFLSRPPELIEYLLENTEPGLCEEPYFLTRRTCGDCTTPGSHIAPEF
ncbi:hypothetical protein [Robiginitalea aurantiaca]|uniref:Uncharacterized protein n=1 Tax=Robiginitalea aurantiaca TaxID=3056915 RepID=A0ABT7WB33_9FLAO|nr:hypothetical protein [Robiginitalea aurantiaca]MDM9630112.1 hypothetical protein [Robiginitalea aurantiaca]